MDLAGWKVVERFPSWYKKLAEAGWLRIAFSVLPIWFLGSGLPKLKFQETNFIYGLGFSSGGWGSGEESFLLPRVQCVVHVGDNPLLAGSAVIYYLLQIEKNSQDFVYFLI